MPAQQRRSPPHSTAPHPSAFRRSTRRGAAFAAIVFAGLTAVACDSATETMAPADGGLANARPAAPAIDVDVGAGSFTIGGAAANVTVTVTNPGKAMLKDVSVVVHAVQGTASREAGREPVTCANAAAGTLPGGATCTIQLAVAVSNTAEGTGSLAAGAAQLQTSLLQASGKKQSVLDTRSDEITLVAATTEPSISDVQLSQTTLVIEGALLDYTVSITNPGAPRSNVVMQALLTQGTTSRAAGGTALRCSGITDGLLPSGSCTFDWHAGASNQNGGSGTLVPGAATLTLLLIEGTTTLDSEDFAVTLVSASTTPEITGVQLATTQFVLNGESVAYTVTLSNPGSTLTGVTLQGEIVQGTTSRGAGGFTVSCPGESIGTLPSGTCSFDVTATASNLAGGGGTFNAGDATLHLYLFDSNGTYDTHDTSISIVEPADVYIYDLTLSTFTFVIGAEPVPYNVTVRNPANGTFSDVTLWATIVQETGQRVVDNENHLCGANLPPGDCSRARSLDVTNSGGGGDLLVPGPAILEIEVRRSGTPTHTVSYFVTLVGPQP